MIINAYSVFDRKSLVYSPPFYSPTDGSATRAFSDAANDPQAPIGAHPVDYVLFQVGTYDDQKGLLAPISPLVHIVDAIALVKHQPSFPGVFSEERPAVRPDLVEPVIHNGKA